MQIQRRLGSLAAVDEEVGLKDEVNADDDSFFSADHFEHEREQDGTSEQPKDSRDVVKRISTTKSEGG